MMAVCGLMLAMAANAQNAYDAERVLSNDLNGTARFVGMGGAMGALGGDMSVMGTNPAGIGIFRRKISTVICGTIIRTNIGILRRGITSIRSTIRLCCWICYGGIASRYTIGHVCQIIKICFCFHCVFF